MKTQFLIACLLLSNISFAQTVAIGTRSIALNSQQALVAENAGTTFLNPSMFLEQQGYSLWVNHYKPYRIAEINVYALAVSYTKPDFAFGAGVMEYGNNLYQDQNFIFSAAYRLLPTFNAGLRFKLRHISISGYGSTNVSSVDVGFHIPAAKNISIGMLVKNAIAGKIGNTGERPGREVLSALRIKIPGSIALFAEIAQEENFAAEHRLGFEYPLFKNMALRLGTGVNTPESFAGGFGIQFGRFQFNYALQNHPDLDQSHIFSITFSGGE